VAVPCKVMLKYSVIIPVYNEQVSITACVEHVIRCFDGTDIEVLVIDAASTDQTQSQVLALGQQYKQVRYHCASVAGRAAQMNYGAEQAVGRCLVFVHADTQLKGAAPASLSFCENSAQGWGFCKLGLDNHKLRYRVLSWFIRNRARLTSVCTGDQTLIVEKTLFWKVGGFPSQRLMEDVELSKALRQHSKPRVFNLRSITSARKWENDGFIRTVLLMWELRLRYYFGESADKLVKRYY